MKLRIAQFGLGPIGVETLKLAATKPWARVVGGVDIDPAKIGKDLGQLTGEPRLRGLKVYRTIEELVAKGKPDLVFHTAVSRFKDAFPQLAAMARLGVDVVSSCEELVFPQLREPALAKKLDSLCRKSRARVLGTGVNPGFVMDVLALCLTGVSCNVTAIHIQRVVNASTRREPLQRKIGSGIAPAQFRKQLRSGAAGHAGLTESLALVAHTLGWPIRDVLEHSEVVIAQREIQTRFLRVKKGETCGIHQRAEGKLNGKVRLTLDLKMYLDAEAPHDTIQIIGTPPLEMVLKGGVAGDQATVAALVNAAPGLVTAKPGLRLMTDLPIPRLC